MLAACGPVDSANEIDSIAATLSAPESIVPHVFRAGEPLEEAQRRLESDGYSLTRSRRAQVGDLTALDAQPGDTILRFDKPTSGCRDYIVELGVATDQRLDSAEVLVSMPCTL